MRSISALIVAMCGVLVFAGAAADAGDDAASEAAQRILVLGDSLTKGYGLLESEAYPAVLEKRLRSKGIECEVVNGGVSGDTSAGGLRRIGWLLKRKPDVLVLALGANDGLRGIDPEATEANLQAIIDKTRAESPNARIVVAGMTVPENLGPEFRRRFEAIFPRLAKANKAAFIPFLLEGVAGIDQLNQADRIHPNAEGQEKIAETVQQHLEPLLEP